MKQYLDLMSNILNDGTPGTNRTGVPDKALFGEQYKVNLEKDTNGIIHGFPLLTTKKVSLRTIFIELMWKLSGNTNIQPLLKQNVHIWTEWPFQEWLKKTEREVRQFTDETQQNLTDEWQLLLKEYEHNVISDNEFAKEFGGLGITYGHNFRHFGEVKIDGVIKVFMEGKDQVSEALHRIRNKPDDRRIIINLWDARNENKTLLPPCPCFYQFNARVEGKLDLFMHQRSCDYFLGVPYNTPQDTLMLCLFAHVTGRNPKTFTHSFGDVHLYHNHFQQAEEQLKRELRALPSIRIKKETDNLFDITWEDIELIGYDPHPAIKGNVAV